MDQSTWYMLISLIKMVTLYQLLLFMVNLIMPKEKKSGLNSNNLKPLLIQISYVLAVNPRVARDNYFYGDFIKKNL